ncbi:hypothetical protein LH51_05655 [Nitrincola sp. A-D6]|nr:hypothetical protein LH51_05655 [Nitrincola sp. A-D6]
MKHPRALVHRVKTRASHGQVEVSIAVAAQFCLFTTGGAAVLKLEALSRPEVENHRKTGQKLCKNFKAGL